MKYKLKAYSIWEFGKRVDASGNPHQEDWLYPEHGNLNGADRLFILCDGMGGHEAGEVASQTVCSAMAETILNGCPDPEGTFGDELLERAIDNAYMALDAKDSGADKKMGTTMTCLKLHADGATVAHMGDSRVYHIRPGKDSDSTKIMFMTEDHSLVNDLVKIGEMTHEEARHSSQKNVITRAMQPGVELRRKADIEHISDIRPGDYFYLCSDGMLEDDEMESGRVLRNIFSAAGGSDEAKVEILRRSTKLNNDNHSAILVHITDVHGAPVIEEVHIDANSGTQAAPRRAIAPTKKRGGFSWFSVIGSIIAVAAVIFGTYVFLSDNGEDPSTDEVESVEEQPVENNGGSSSPQLSPGNIDHRTGTPAQTPVQDPGQEPLKALKDEKNKVSDTKESIVPIVNQLGPGEEQIGGDTVDVEQAAQEITGGGNQQIPDKQPQPTEVQ